MEKDLAMFFRDLELPDEELRNALENYRKHNPNCTLSGNGLFEAVRAEAARPR